MASKIIQIPGVGTVTLIKRAQNRNIRLSVTNSGVQVSMPRWTPFQAGSAFATANAAWIINEQAKYQQASLESGQKIGKLHYLRFEQVLNGKPATSRVTATEIIVRLQPQETIADQAVQIRARQAATRALKREAERLLPPRLQSLAQKHNLSYTRVHIKQLKRRWGSCDSHRVITLNMYLMELPWEYIDYVLLHELTHTEHMNHGEGFWRLLTQLEPQARAISKSLRKQSPSVGDWHSPNEP